MKFEVAEAWPDKSAEYKALADAANDAHADGKSIKIDLDERKWAEGEDPTPFGDAEGDRLRAALANQIRKHGRFDVKREGRFAYVRVSTAAPRTKKAATKKAAPAKTGK